MSSSKIFYLLLSSFIGGIFISSFFSIPNIIVYELFVLAFLYALFREKKIIVFALCLLFIGLGILRLQTFKGSNYFEKQYVPKEKVRNIIYQNFSLPESSFLAALTLGEKKNIPKQWKEKLNRSGLRHITAISGMHIIILSSIFTTLLITLGLSRLQSFYFVITLLWAFIAFIGFQPSAVRAGIMASTLLFCQKIGRPRAGSQGLLLAGGLMLFFNPLLIRESLGFQLSFLASMGIVYLYPIISKIKLPDLLSVTFSAQIFVLPILIYRFGYFSLVSPITNILIVPILPILMSFGFLLLVSGLIYYPLSIFVSFFVWPLLEYLVFIINFFSKLPIAEISAHIPLLFVPVYYLLLFLFLYFEKKRPFL